MKHLAGHTLWFMALSASICGTVSSGDLSRSRWASVSDVVTRSPSGRASQMMLATSSSTLPVPHCLNPVSA